MGLDSSPTNLTLAPIITLVQYVWGHKTWASAWTEHKTPWVLFSNDCRCGQTLHHLTYLSILRYIMTLDHDPIWTDQQKIFLPDTEFPAAPVLVVTHQCIVVQLTYYWILTQNFLQDSLPNVFVLNFSLFWVISPRHLLVRIQTWSTVTV